MTDTSGPKFCEPFALYDPDESCWRTSQGTFPWASDEFSQTWPRAGTWDLGYAYERPTLAPHTSAPESSSLLPTPTAGDSKASGSVGYNTESGRHSGTTLTDAARLLPTPTARLGKAGADYRDRSEGADLFSAVRGVATPQPSPDGNESQDEPLPFR